MYSATVLMPDSGLTSSTSGKRDIWMMDAKSLIGS